MVHTSTGPNATSTNYKESTISSAPSSAPPSPLQPLPSPTSVVNVMENTTFSTMSGGESDVNSPSPTLPASTTPTGNTTSQTLTSDSGSISSSSVSYSLPSVTTSPSSSNPSFSSTTSLSPSSSQESLPSPTAQASQPTSSTSANPTTSLPGSSGDIGEQPTGSYSAFSGPTTSTSSSAAAVPVTTSVPVSLVSSVPISPTNQSSTTNSSSDNGALIGGIVGGVVALLLGVGLCFFLCRRRRAISRQLLHPDDLHAPRSPRDIEVMHEANLSESFYSSVSLERPHHSQSFGSSVELQHPVAPASLTARSLPYLRTAPESESALVELVPGSNDGHIPDDGGAGASENASTKRGTQSTSAKKVLDKSLYNARNDARSQSSVTINSSQIGLATGSRVALSNSYSTRSGRDLLTPSLSYDGDEDSYIPSPSPSEFPVPPSNPSINVKQIHVRTWSMQEASWAAAVAAASPVQANTPTAKSTPSFAFSLYTTKSNEKSSPVDITSPDPFRRNSEHNGRGQSKADMHEAHTVEDPDPLAGLVGSNTLTVGSQVQDTGNEKMNRLSSTGSVVEIPDNPSECGIAL